MLLVNCGICILAGGLSERMGREKARLRLGPRTLLGHVRAAAIQVGLPVRIIRRDQVPRCGPLGGIYTALKTSRSKVEVFLACDMPFVSAELIGKLLNDWQAHGRAVFIQYQKEASFPMLAPVKALAVVERQIHRKQLSLQNLARVLNARFLPVPKSQTAELSNVNTPEDWDAARGKWRVRQDLNL